MNHGTVIVDYQEICDLAGQMPFSLDITRDLAGVIGVESSCESLLDAIDDDSFKISTPEDEPVQVCTTERYVAVKHINKEFQPNTVMVALKKIEPDESLAHLSEFSGTPVEDPDTFDVVDISEPEREQVLDHIETIALNMTRRDYRIDDPVQVACKMSTFVETYIGEAQGVQVYLITHKNPSGAKITSVYSRSRAPECLIPVTEFHGIQSVELECLNILSQA